MSASRYIKDVGLEDNLVELLPGVDSDGSAGGDNALEVGPYACICNAFMSCSTKLKKCSAL
jgi:hypothetical protein